ncbi:MAG: Maf family protein [Candidatus Acidiferrales bacterium]
MKKLYLASGSPRRAQILRDAHIAFETVAAPVDESARAGESALERVLRLARAKAEAGVEAVRRGAGGAAEGRGAGLERMRPSRGAGSAVAEGALLIGADTEVVIDGEVLGKPESGEDARRMLRRLAGRTHEVITGVALVRLPDGERRVEHEVTRVTFAPLSDAEIEAYVASEEHRDKAGGYAIQGRGGTFVTRVEGCYFNVVGLPLARLWRMMREMGWK